MELTKNYQRLGEAYLGYSAGNLYIRIYAKINSQSIQNNTSNVSYQSRLYFDGSHIISQGQTKVEMRGTNISNTTTNWQNFEGRQDGYYYNGETTVKTITTTITHDSSGNASINASAIFTSAGSWGWSATASGSATLPNLHKAPEFEVAEMVETNQDMINLNIPDTTIVRYLSEKQITLHGIAYDDATLTYRLEHFGTNYNVPSTGYRESNVFNTNYRTNDITLDSNNKASIVQKLADSLNGTATDWLYINIGGTAQKPNAIPYAKPALVGTSTTIKRKSGNGTNLTDNKANLNLVGTIYKANDIIGNDNSITQVGYKIWQRDTTEPQNYTPLTPTISGGDITVSNFEISNVLFTEVYNYKIKVADKYYEYEIEGTVPLGQALWTEYKDRVDFLRITRNNEDVYPNVYSTSEEIIVGKWIDGKPIYRKVIETTTTAGYINISRNSIASNIELFTKLDGITIQPNTSNISPINYYYNSNDYSNIYVSDTNVVIRCGSNYGFGSTKLIVEYTKTTDV